MIPIELHRAVAVVDCTPVWVEQFGSEQAFFSWANQNPGEDPLAEPIELNVIALERPCLIGGQGSLDGNGSNSGSHLR